MTFNKKYHIINELIVLSYSSIYRLSVELASRSYGGGALEILSGDFNKLRVPKVVPTPDYKSIRQQIEGWIKEGISIYQIVKSVDRELLPCCNFSEVDLKIIYNTWENLCTGRNTRERSTTPQLKQEVSSP